MTASRALKAEFPSKLRPLFEAIRYKILYGGRGGAKSWSIARAILTIGIHRKIRVLCAREIMHTVKESVHQLLKDQVEDMGYSDHYTVLNTEITGRNGTQITFTGLRALTATNIKSFESVDICWVEEAQVVRFESWRVLIPTIRKKGSEIWLSFNPDLDTDDTYTRFVENTPPNSVLIEINWRDNWWFFETEMPQERLHSLKTDDEQTYMNTWEGTPRTVVAGAIYAREVTAMIKAKRYRAVPYDPMLPVHTVWDLGWNDQNSVIFMQKLRNEISVIDYCEASFLTFSDWAKVLAHLPYSYGTHWFPWDGEAESQQTGKSDAQVFGELVTAPVKIIKKYVNAVEARITASRNVMPRIYLNNTPVEEFEVNPEIKVIRGGARLMECWKRYRRNVPTTTGEPATPMHDQFSHGCDASGGMCINIAHIKNDSDRAPPMQYEQHEPSVPGVM